jgi:predicted nucleic acid-binding protein
MKPMRDKVFADTNVLLYLLSNDKQKKQISKEILSSRPFISTQVLNEFSNVCIKKLKITSDSLLQVLETIDKHVRLVGFTSATIHAAIRLQQRYQLQYYDSLIIATALENGCDLLLSEDLQHSMLINNQLKIINPFI